MTTAAKKHRLLDQLAKLTAENDQLRAEADKLAESVWRGIQDAGALAEALTQVDTLTGKIDALTTERDQLAADLANARAIRVPAGVRDTSDRADQATAPYGISVRPLWEALGVRGVA